MGYLCNLFPAHFCYLIACEINQCTLKYIIYSLHDKMTLGFLKQLILQKKEEITCFIIRFLDKYDQTCFHGIILVIFITPLRNENLI